MKATIDVTGSIRIQCHRNTTRLLGSVASGIPVLQQSLIEHEFMTFHGLSNVQFEIEGDCFSVFVGTIYDIYEPDSKACVKSSSSS